MQTEPRNLFVTLASVLNYDFPAGERGKRIAPRIVPTDSLANASRTCRRFIESHGLGGGNWVGGQVTDEALNPVARVSYNGRVWAPDGSEIKV